jgi:hypothetical protein
MIVSYQERVQQHCSSRIMKQSSVTGWTISVHDSLGNGSEDEWLPVNGANSND